MGSGLAGRARPENRQGVIGIVSAKEGCWVFESQRDKPRLAARCSAGDAL